MRIHTHNKRWLGSRPVSAAGWIGVYLMISVALSSAFGATYTNDWENTSNKTAYTTGNLTVNGITWQLSDALATTGDTNDRKNGTRSARLRDVTGVITMLGDKSGGISNISFYHAKYGTDGNSALATDYSTDGGTTWINAGTVTVSSTTLTLFSTNIHQTGNVRIRIRKTAGTGTSNRNNVDDIRLTDYSAAAPDMKIMGTNGTTEIVNGDDTPSGADGTDFGSFLYPGTAGITNVFTITNAGTANLDLTGSSPYVTLSGHPDFTVIAPYPSTPIAPNAITTFRIKFDPAASGTRTALVSIANSDTSKNPYTFAIRGTGASASPPTVTTRAISNITAATADGGGEVTDDGGASVTSRGVCWNSSPNPTTAHFATTNGAGVGAFNSVLTDLEPGNVYYVRAYAINSEGTAYGSQVIFTAACFSAPMATAATEADSSSFKANWNAVQGATGYLLDVATNDSFISSGPGGTNDFNGVGGGTSYSYLTRPFTNNGVPWTAYKARTDQTIDGMPTITLRDEADAYLVSTQITGGVASITFVHQQKFTGSGGQIGVFVNGSNYGYYSYSTDVQTTTVHNINQAGLCTITLTNNGAARPAITRLVWTGHGGAFVPGYVARPVGTTTIFSVTGLTANTHYFYRVRATNAYCLSDHSNIITAQTAAAASPEIAVLGTNGMEIANSDFAPSVADGTHFGNVAFCGVTVTNSFIITNSGAANLVLSGNPKVTLSGHGDFSVSLQPSSPVVPGGVTSFQLVFDPTATGTRTALVSIANNDDDENPYVFAVAGVGASVVEPTWFGVSDGGCGINALSWSNNAGGSAVMIAFHTEPTFGAPVDGTSYSTGQTLTGGGTILFKGTGSNFNHSGCTPGATYYYRIWSADNCDSYSATNLSVERTIPCDCLSAPVSLSAVGIGTASFTARWETVSGASGYLLDVATNSAFQSGGGFLINEGFDAGTNPPAGWTFTGIDATYNTSGNYGSAPPSLRMDTSNDQIVTATFLNPTSVSFWIKGQSVDTNSRLIVEKYDGSWSTLISSNNLPTTGTTWQYPLAASVTRLRFIYHKSVGNLAIDDIRVRGAGSAAGDFVAGYEKRPVGNTDRFAVTGLLSGVTYYYRVRATNAYCLSGYSATQQVTTALPGDSTPPVSTNVLIGGVTTLSDHVLGGSQLTVSLADEGTGLATNPPPSYTIRYPSGVSNESGVFKAHFAPGVAGPVIVTNETALNTYFWGIGIHTVEVSVADMNANVSVMQHTFTVQDDDTEAPTLGSTPFQVRLGSTPITTEMSRTNMLAVWNFNNVTTLTAVSHGAGTLSNNFTAITNFTGTTLNRYASDFAGRALAIQAGAGLTNNGRFLQFLVDMSGMKNLVMTFAVQKTAAGFTNNQVYWSTNGVDFTAFGAPFNPPGTNKFSVITNDFSSVAALNNRPQVYIRITLNGATHQDGNNRFDNIRFHAKSDAIELTDAELASVGPTNPLQFAIQAYDSASGLARGTTGDGTNMRVSVTGWITNNTANYDAAQSSANTTVATASSLWTWAAAFSSAEISQMVGNNNSNRPVRVTVADLDNDRFDDRLWLSNALVGTLRFSDDDAAPPRAVPGGFSLFIGDTPIQPAAAWGEQAAETNLIAGWNFNNTADRFEVTYGSGQLTHNFESGITDFSGTSTNLIEGDDPGRDLALQSGTSQVNEGKHIQFEIDMSSYKNLVMSLAARRTTDGFASNRVSYSVNGGEFVTFLEPWEPMTLSYRRDVFDFSSVTAMNGATSVIIRITFRGSVSGGTPNNRLDNVQFHASPITAAYYYELTDGQLASVSATNPMWWSFHVHDLESGVARGSAANGTNMMVSADGLLTNNTSRFSATRSSSDTRVSTSTSVWLFTETFAPATVGSLYADGTNNRFITATFCDLDNDRDSDGLWVSNNLFAVFRVTDDDTNAPSAPDSVQVSPHNWTNSIYFTVLWNPATDASGIAEYRIATNQTTGLADGHSAGNGWAFTLTNRTEGVTTGWIFAVDADMDRPGDQLRSTNVSFVMRLDTTAPARVTGLISSNGPDDTSEVYLKWNPLPDAGGRAGDPLSPWYSYVIFYTDEDRSPTTNDAFVHVGHGYLSLGTNTTQEVIVSNLLFGSTYRFAVAGLDRAGNLGQLSDPVQTTLAGIHLTQAVIRAATYPQLYWNAATNAYGQVIREYDIIYCDSYGFSESLSNKWQLLDTRMTNTTVDMGSASRTPPWQLGDVMRFYRVAPTGRWGTNRNPRAASVEIYGLRNIRLYRGQNWIASPFQTDGLTLVSVLGHNLPASPIAGTATKVLWYAQTNAQVASRTAWLCDYGTSNQWLTGIGHVTTNTPADHLVLNPSEGFIVEIPAHADPSYNVVIIGRVPTNSVTRPIVGGGAYNLIGYHLPRYLHPSEMNLLESGFRGSASGYPTGGDRIWSYNRQTQRAKAEAWYDLTTGRWRLNQTPNFPDVPAGYFGPDDALVIRSHATTTNWVWTNRVLYKPPTRSLSP